MLNQLADTGNEEETGLIREMYDILAEYLDQIAIYENEAADLREVYDYEWTDEEI